MIVNSINTKFAHRYPNVQAEDVAPVVVAGREAAPALKAESAS